MRRPQKTFLWLVTLTSYSKVLALATSHCWFRFNT